MFRRTFISGLTLTSICAAVGNVNAAQDTDIELADPLPPLPQELAQFENDRPADYLQIVAVGTGKPSGKDIQTAYDLMVNAPYNCSPVEVAGYFRDVGQGKYGDDAKPFAREWPKIANPIIFHFFSATSTKPEGDVTAWCAAFLNWCIMRAHATEKDQIGKSPSNEYSKSGKLFDPTNFEKFATQNASSGSFRCWKAINSPKEGDIAVLADKGTEGLTKLCLGQGHVTFFLSKIDKDHILAVGGNQVQAGSHGAVTHARLFVGQGSRFMKFVSVNKDV